MSVPLIFSRMFPAPQYLRMPSVGIDVSDNSLKFMKFKRKRAHDTYLHLEHWGDLKIPAGAVERGDLKDVDALAEVLREVKLKTDTDYVRLSLPEERAYLFETTVKHNTPYKEIRGLLEFKLEENVPIAPRDAFFDYTIVEGDEAEKVLRIVVTVYAKETILKYYEACQKAGLIPLSFEIEAQAIARAAFPDEHAGTYMLVDFGKTRTGIGIVHKGTLMYTSTVDIGGLTLSAKMREFLGEVSESELTSVKNTKGLVVTKEHRAVAQALQKVTDTIIEEVETRIHYWHTRDIERGERDIEKVVLCGGSSNLRGLPEYVSQKLGVPAERAEVWKNAFSTEKFIPPITERYSFGYATAVGLGLADFSKLTNV